MWQSSYQACIDPLWQQAMQEELNALETFGTWELVDRPSNKALVGCKWVYKIKTCYNGSIDCHKDRLV